MKFCYMKSTDPSDGGDIIEVNTLDELVAIVDDNCADNYDGFGGGIELDRFRGEYTIRECGEWDFD